MFACIRQRFTKTNLRQVTAPKLKKPRDEDLQNKAVLDSLFRILNTASRYESYLSSKNKKRTNRILWQYLLLCIVAPSLISIALIIISYSTKYSELQPISLLFLGLGYLGLFFQPFVEIFANRKSVMATLRHPFGRLLKNARQTSEADIRFLPKLLRKKLEHLELLQLEIKSEREFFERRIAIVSGAIDKVGLAPGVLAALISITPLINNSNTNRFVLALAYATPILQVFGAFSHNLLMRLDRMVKLLDLAIARRKENISKNNEPKI